MLESKKINLLGTENLMNKKKTSNKVIVIFLIILNLYLIVTAYINLNASQKMLAEQTEIVVILGDSLQDADTFSNCLQDADTFSNCLQDAGVFFDAISKKIATASSKSQELEIKGRNIFIGNVLVFGGVCLILIPIILMIYRSIQMLTDYRFLRDHYQKIEGNKSVIDAELESYERRNRLLLEKEKRYISHIKTLQSALRDQKKDNEKRSS